jgi:hypothetical protein
MDMTVKATLAGAAVLTLMTLPTPAVAEKIIYDCPLEQKLPRPILVDTDAKTVVDNVDYSGIMYNGEPRTNRWNHPVRAFVEITTNSIAWGTIDDTEDEQLTHDLRLRMGPEPVQILREFHILDRRTNSLLEGADVNGTPVGESEAGSCTRKP